MNEKPEALKLAEKLEGYSPNSGYATYCHKAAAELRRLHKVNAELLFALKNLLNAKNGESAVFDSDEIARAAIAKAEGGAA